MKLLLKVVKSSQVFSEGNAVDIDNTVKLPPLPVNPEEMNDAQRLAKQKQEEARRVKEQIAAEVEEKISVLKAEIDIKRAEIVESAENSKLNIISEATKKAEEIIATANKEAEIIKEKARQDGKEEGFKAGKAEALEQCDKYIQAAAQFLSGVNAKKDAYFISLEDEILETVMTMVKKITLEEIKTDKDIILGILKQAAKTFKNDDYLKISFAQGDVSADIVTDIDFIRTVVGNINDIDVEFLPDAEKGTVIVDNGSEIIDASVPTQLDLLKEIMNNSRGNQQ